LEREIKCVNEKSERESAIKEAMRKNAFLTADFNRAQYVQELKVKHEVEKQKFNAMAADEFRSF
jgi:hypothetical protein